MNIYTSLNLDETKFNLQDTQYYVYIYLDPFTEIPIYIGKGKNSRMYEHLKINDKSKGKFQNKLKKILKTGYLPIIYKIKENLNAFEALNLEHFFIEFFGIKNRFGDGVLYNSKLGGFGGDTYKYISEKDKIIRSINQTTINVNRFKNNEERKNIGEKQRKYRQENPDKVHSAMKLRHINMKLRHISEICYKRISNGNKTNALAKKIFRWINNLPINTKIHKLEDFKIFLNQNRKIIYTNLGFN